MYHILLKPEEKFYSSKTIPMGDDHMYDVLDDVGMTDERRLQKWDEPVYKMFCGKH